MPVREIEMGTAAAMNRASPMKMCRWRRVGANRA